MGAYLSKPITEKFSSDEASEFIDVGASSMQGWRISQEDAHNCILDFDEKTSLFAVYDGHGGAEVATYCAQKLPEYLKDLEAYKSGDYEQALKNAFLGFDQTLLKEDVIEILKKLADERNPDRDSELAEEEEEEDLAELCQEGSLPLDQVLEKYKTAKLHGAGCSKNDDQKAVASGSGTSRPLSRFLRGRCNSIEMDSPTEEFQDTSDEQDDDEALESDDICVSSSNVDKVKPVNTDVTTTVVIGETCKISNLNKNGGLKCTSPDSSLLNSNNTSTNNGQEKLKNGDIKLHDDSGVNESEKVSSTSSSPPVTGSSSSSKQENGIPSTFSTACPNQNVCGNSSSSGSSYKKAGRSIKDYSGNNIVGCQVEDDESSSEEDDADFHAEENSSTEDGEEDCEPCDEETEEENEEEETEDEEVLIDDGFCANMIEEPGKDSGCTAVIALLHGKDLYVANAGDSRCVLCRGGEAIEMSLDHKPEDEREKNRIYKAGGKVTMDGRVNGGLNLSRAIGDHAYKMNKDLPADEQMISALPDIKKIVITPDDEFMILACDGIWNYMSSEEVVEFIKTRLDEGRESISKIIEELFDNCLAPHTIGDGTGCDNMTAVIVRFKQPKILELPTILLEKSEVETAVVSSKKRLASISVENEVDNDTNTSSCKRIKTEEDSNKIPSSSSSSLAQSSKAESENVSPNNITSTTATVATVSTTTTSTPVSTQKEQDSLVASTT